MDIKRINKRIKDGNFAITVQLLLLSVLFYVLVPSGNKENILFLAWFIWILQRQYKRTK